MSKQLKKKHSLAKRWIHWVNFPLISGEWGATLPVSESFKSAPLVTLHDVVRLRSSTRLSLTLKSLYFPPNN